MLGALLLAAACARAPSPVVVLPEAERPVAELEAAHPIGPTTNIRVDELARTAALSVHLVQVRGGERPHRHTQHDLVVCVVRGEGILTMGGTQRRLRAGDVAVVPRGTPHWFVNAGQGVATALVAFVPPLDAPDSVPLDVDTPGSPR